MPAQDVAEPTLIDILQGIKAKLDAPATPGLPTGAATQTTLAAVDTKLGTLDAAIGPLDATAENDPAAVSATTNALLRGILNQLVIANVTLATIATNTTPA